MKAFLAGAAVLVAGAAHAGSLAEVWRLGGFILPESAYYDAGSDQIVVSNIGVFGPDGGMDGKLSLVSPDGVLIAADWVTGLIDPKGMASAGGKLYVADQTGLVVVDIATGTVDQTIALADALLPNDVTIAADGTIYVTDMFAGSILRVKGSVVDRLVPPGAVALPNGILADGDRLVIGSFGDVMNPDFSVNKPGGLFLADIATGAVTPVAEAQEVASIDGIVIINGTILYNDNPTGLVWAYADGVNTNIGSVGPGAADMGAMGDLLLIPNLGTGEVTAWKYTP